MTDLERDFMSAFALGTFLWAVLAGAAALAFVI
jgi:hypothetical protein